ncbi:MAG TPA: hypothetical protein V6D17_02010, partial [Candidatus Obscuribacterales bacterium]
MDESDHITQLVQPIRDDLLSGAAEIALRAITIFQTVMQEENDAERLHERLIETSRALIDAQPAMAPLFHLSNSVLLSVRGAKTADEIRENCQEALTKFEKSLCESAEVIANHVLDLIP